MVGARGDFQQDQGRRPAPSHSYTRGNELDFRDLVFSSAAKNGLKVAPPDRIGPCLNGFFNSPGSGQQSEALSLSFFSVLCSFLSGYLPA